MFVGLSSLHVKQCELKWLPALRQGNITWGVTLSATLTFKALHPHQPTYFYQLWNIYSPTRQLRCSLLVKPETSNKTSDRAFAITAATSWNRLPPKVRTATSTEQFSRALKTHLFTLDWSRGSPRRLWLVISTDELWRRIQIEWFEWLIDCTCTLLPVSITYPESCCLLYNCHGMQWECTAPGTDLYVTVHVQVFMVRFDPCLHRDSTCQTCATGNVSNNRHFCCSTRCIITDFFLVYCNAVFLWHTCTHITHIVTVVLLLVSL